MSGHVRPHPSAENPFAGQGAVLLVDRPAEDTTVPSLVFGALAEGTYELFPKGGGPVRLTADVRGGAVTEVAWG